MIDPANYDTSILTLVEHLETCTHMHVTSTEPGACQQWGARRSKARLALLDRVALKNRGTA